MQIPSILRSMDLKQKTAVWSYLSQGQKDLIEEGQYLLEEIIKHEKYSFKDYSFLVFPFAKAYEGFLKQIFLEIGFITHDEYTSDHFRLGKVLSPHLVARLGGRSVYKKICDQSGVDLADQIWDTWKIGRNQVFHYFPHNLRSLTLSEAEEITTKIGLTMETTISQLKIDMVKSRLKGYS